jgi:hypothetical protein
MDYNRSFRTTGVAVAAGCVLAIASSAIGAAATIEEVAHCRGIQQLAERLNCFKSLKPGPRVKTQDATPAKQHAGLPKVKDSDTRANTKETVPAKTPAKTEQAAPAKTDDAAPAKTETTTQSHTGEGSSPTPATTSSIDRLSFAHDQPLCQDRDNLVAAILAGLLTSDPSQALTPGCQAIPDDAKLEPLERFPSTFSFMRTIRVKVTSPTQPDLTSGFTIEMLH